MHGLLFSADDACCAKLDSEALHLVTHNGLDNEGCDEDNGAKESSNNVGDIMYLHAGNME